MKAIEFLRVSTHEQGADDRAGIPRQREANAQTALKHSLTIIKSITIIDVSGTSVLHTPEVKELLSLIQAPDVSGIVVADWDRLIRLDNFRDFALLQNLKETGTLIYLPDQVIDLNTQSGFLIGGFQSIISGNELTQIKKRMLAAKEVKRRNGEHPNCDITLPTGVGYDRDRKRFYYTHDINKVKNLFDLFLKGIHNYHELQRLTGFHHRTIANLLRNEIYAGYRTYTQKRSPEKSLKPGGRQGDKKKVRRSEGEIIRVRVIDEPAIPETAFKQVQRAVSDKSAKYHEKRSKPGARFLYAGFLRCGVCGDLMYSTSGGRNHRKDYYYCRTKNYRRKKKNCKSDCKSGYIRKETLEHTVTSFLSEQLTDRTYLESLIGLALSDSAFSAIDQEIELLRDEIRKVQRKRLKILDLYSDGLFTKDELDGKAAQLNSEMAGLNSRLERLEEQAALRDRFAAEKAIIPLVTTLAEFPYWQPCQKRAFLKSQVPEISVTPEGITGFMLNFCENRTRTGRDSWHPPA